MDDLTRRELMRGTTIKFAGLVLCLCGGGMAASPHIQESLFVADKDGKVAGWTTWSARAETSPRMFVDRGALAISGNSNIAGHGGWERRVERVEPGRWYRFTARYRAEAVPAESWQVGACESRGRGPAALSFERSAGNRGGMTSRS